jgi:hypothetical protein
MTPFFKSPMAAQQLGMRYSHLMSLIRHNKIMAPSKDSSGDYFWTEDDIAAVRAVLATSNRRRERFNS